MSILAATSAPEPISPVQLAWAGGMIAFGVMIAYFLGAFRAASVSGPVRPARDESVVAVLVLLLVAFFIWLGSQFVYGMILAVQHRASASPEPFSAKTFTPIDYSILATAPFVLGLLVFFIGARFTHRELPRELGWSTAHLPGGIGLGLLAMISVLPLMLGASILLIWFYQLVGYDHPTEHDLLTVLGRSRDPVTKVLIIGGATLLAPAFEEFLFRGHLQTLLVRAFGPRKSEGRGFQVVHEMPPPPVFDESDAPMTEPFAVTSTPAPPAALAPAVGLVLESDPAPGPSPAARWAAIVTTALLFAVLHPMWTWPLIFLLALALGYAYERTANLWVVVTMHLVFNTFNTVLFLYVRPL